MTKHATKTKLSVTLSRELIAEVDREVTRRPGSSRSGVIESWLRLGSRASEAQRLHQDTIAYYEARSRAERLEDEEWATFASDEFSAVAESEADSYDDRRAPESGGGG